MQLKTCTRCKLTKAITEFDIARSRKDGHNFRCSACIAEVRALPENRARANAATKAWTLENREQRDAWQRKNYQENRTERLHGRRRYLYGLEPEQFEQMKKDQDNKCKICGTSEPRGRGNWHVDHDHETGAVRSLLCTDCNTGLGKFLDSPALLIAAAQYLQQHTMETNYD
jgi:hypothetical protein